jgi:hypothetical protein
MDEEPHIAKTGDEARQGERVKGMTTVLAVSILAAGLGMVLVFVFFVAK